MADRYDFFLEQLVTEGEVDAAFDAMEQADRDIVSDAGLVGVMTGMVVTQHAPTADFTVDMTAGVCYDQNGKRIEVGSGQTVDLSIDYNGVSTAVAGSGNSKVISIFAYADRNLSDPRVDGNSNTVQYSRAETFAFKVVQGSEATTGTETAPALESDKILIADVTVDYAQTQILTADVNSNAVGGNRRQDAFVATAGSLTVREGTAEEAASALLTELNTHITDVGNAHDASAIGATISTTWHDGSAVSATDLDAVIEEIIADLVATAGADRIGGAAYTSTGPVNMTAGSVQDQLRAAFDSFNGRSTTNAWVGVNTFTQTELVLRHSTPASDFELNVDADDLLVNVRSGGHITFQENGTDQLKFDFNGSRYQMQFGDAFNAEIEMTTLAGTGANDGNNMILQAQNGQPQTGATDNNDGGNLYLNPGAPGTGGSGAAGFHGNVIHQWNTSTSPIVQHTYSEIQAETGPITKIIYDSSGDADGITYHVEVTFLIYDPTANNHRVEKRAAVFRRFSSTLSIIGSVATPTSGNGQSIVGADPTLGLSVSTDFITATFDATSSTNALDCGLFIEIKRVVL